MASPERIDPPVGSGAESLLEVSSQAPRLDENIHGRVRLGIVTALAAAGTLSFSELRDVLETSDGNLSVHARRLEKAGYVKCRKGFEGRMPRTEYELTAAGREALARYLKHMQALIEAASSGHHES